MTSPVTLTQSTRGSVLVEFGHGTARAIVEFAPAGFSVHVFGDAEPRRSRAFSYDDAASADEFLRTALREQADVAQGSAPQYFAPAVPVVAFAFDPQDPYRGLDSTQVSIQATGDGSFLIETGGVLYEATDESWVWIRPDGAVEIHHHEPERVDSCSDGTPVRDEVRCCAAARVPQAA